MPIKNTAWCLVPQVRAHNINVRGFHFSGFGALTWAGGFHKPSDNLESLGNPRLARLRLRGTWDTKQTFNNPTPALAGDAAGATFVRSTPPVVYAVVVPALFAYAKDGAPASVVASAV
jgi:hypothetical protein